jgi:hypothetical protein
VGIYFIPDILATPNGQYLDANRLKKRLLPDRARTQFIFACQRRKL